MPTDPPPLPFAYRVFGITIGADRPIESLAVASVIVPPRVDLRYFVGQMPPLAKGWDRADPLYVSPLLDRSGRSVLRVLRCGGIDILDFAGAAAFFLHRSSVTCQPFPGADPAAVEACLLSSVLAYWLEGAGRICLHASAVAVEERAVAFMAESGGGKSAIAAALVSAGHELLADDIAVIERRVADDVIHRGWPILRLLPDAAGELAGAIGDVKEPASGSQKLCVRIGGKEPGITDPSDPLPCAALVIASRERGAQGASPAGFDRLPGSEAVIELIRHSFVARSIGAAGIPAERFERLAGLAARVPVIRLRYATGYQQLSAVVKEVERLVRESGERFTAGDEHGA